MLAILLLSAVLGAEQRNDPYADYWNLQQRMHGQRLNDERMRYWMYHNPYITKPAPRVAAKIFTPPEWYYNPPSYQTYSPYYSYPNYSYPYSTVPYSPYYSPYYYSPNPYPNPYYSPYYNRSYYRYRY